MVSFIASFFKSIVYKDKTKKYEVLYFLLQCFLFTLKMYNLVRFKYYFSFPWTLQSGMTFNANK